MKKLDYALSFALIVFAAGHGFLGTPASYGWNSPEAVWSFSASVAAWLIAALNILRVSRPGDRGLAAAALIGALAWIGLMLWLAPVAGMMGDIRIWLFVMTAGGLALFSAKGLLRRS